MQDRVGVIEELARDIADSYFLDTYDLLETYDGITGDYHESLVMEIEATLWDDKCRKGLIADFKGMLEYQELPEDSIAESAEIIRRMEAL